MTRYAWWTILGVAFVISAARAEEPEISATSENKVAAIEDQNEPSEEPSEERAPKRTAKGRRGVEKDTEGTKAPNRFEADTVIRSQYTLNGEPLEVDPD